MVEHKIADVADEVCESCNQCWEGECRAFLMPHSQEERNYRVEDPTMKCQDQLSERVRKMDPINITTVGRLFKWGGYRGRSYL